MLPTLHPGRHTYDSLILSLLSGLCTHMSLLWSNMISSSKYFFIFYLLLNDKYSKIVAIINPTPDIANNNSPVLAYAKSDNIVVTMNTKNNTFFIFIFKLNMV